MRSFPQAIASRHSGLCVQIPSDLELMVDTAVRDSFSYSSELVFESRREVLGQPLKDYHDTFSAFASMTTFRIFINVTAS